MNPNDVSSITILVAGFSIWCLGVWALWWLVGSIERSHKSRHKR